jgi:hypothetical protein
MRKVILSIALVVGVLAVVGFAFREPLTDALVERITTDMFVAADTDAFDPGIAVGSPLPPIRALADGREVNGVDAYMGERGAILVANRSVDW